jgi:mRNA interferase RelE/StbE
LSYNLRLERAARKALQKKIHPQDASKVRETLETLADDPYPRQGLKLRDREGYRLRIGDYRVIYEVDETEKIITVLEVGHRQGIYG